MNINDTNHCSLNIFLSPSFFIFSFSYVFSIDHIYPLSTTSIGQAYYTLFVFKPASSRTPEFCNQPPFQPHVRCGNIFLIWMCCVTQTCVIAIVCWPSVIITTCCAIPTLWHWSKIGYTLMDLAWLCRFETAPRLNFNSFSFTKRSNMRTICRRLRGVSMGSRFPKLFCCLSSYVVPLVTST